MATSFMRVADTDSSSYGGGLHLVSQMTTRLACVPEASPNLLSISPSGPSAEHLATVATVLYRGSFSPGFVVLGLASVFFAFSLALFAICTGLVDTDLKLEGAYLRNTLFLERLRASFLTIVDAVGEASLALPSRVISGFLVPLSDFALVDLSWCLRIFGQGIGAPCSHAESVANLPYVSPLGVQGEAIAICAPSRSFKLAKHLCRIHLRETHRRVLELTRECFVLGAEWIYALGMSLYAVICAGATLALALADRLPSRRTYCRAWSGSMRFSKPHGQHAALPQPDTSQLHRRDALLTWCVQHGEPPAPGEDIGAHAEMSFNISLDLDIDEDGELCVALVPDAPMRCSATTVRVLCDAETQTEDMGPGTEEKEMSMEECHIGSAPGSLEGGREGIERMNMHSLATSGVGFRTPPSMRGHGPAFPSRAFTFKFNPHAPSFSPAHPAFSPVANPPRHAVDGRCDTTLPRMHLNPLAEEFKAPRLFLLHDVGVNVSLGNARGVGRGAGTDGRTPAGEHALTLPPFCRLSKSRATVLRADLSRLATSASTSVDSGAARKSALKRLR